MKTYIILAFIAFFPFVLGLIAAFFIFKIKSKNKNEENKLNFLLEELKNEIKKLADENKINQSEVKFAINETSKLTKALTTNQNLKGNFGENCLEAVLNSCFGCEKLNYIKQFQTTNENGEKIKPDYLINLPNNKNIIIDSKLNLEKFIDYNEASEELKIVKKNELIKDLNSTINSLSNKKYQTAQDLTQPDFVLMYIPLEALITLIYTDNDFISVVRAANEKNITIVGNSSIITTLKLVNLLWANEIREKNIDKIISTTSEIYNLVALHSRNLSQMKQTIDSLYQSFNKEFDKIKENSKLFSAVEELRSYGIQAQNKKIGKTLNEVKIDTAFL